MKKKIKGFKNSKRKKICDLDLVKLIDNLREKMAVEFRHVRGHSGIYGNEMADKLARQAIVI